MTQEHIDRLAKLAEHLEKGQLAHEHFDFSVFNDTNSSECGSAGCAIGECPAIWPDRFRWVDGGPYMSTGLVMDNLHPEEIDDDFVTPGAKFFGLGEKEWQHLFLPYDQRPELFGGIELAEKATRYDVAANIRAFIEIKTAHPDFAGEEEAI